MKDWLSIGEFSQRTGFSSKALKVYEEKGLLKPHARSESHYRYYSVDQIAIAGRIQHYKKLGFSLEQIKAILRETDTQTLKELLESRLRESRQSQALLSVQIKMLESLLTSLNQGNELTHEQRSQIMESLIQSSVSNLKRRGVVPDDAVFSSLSREVAQFSPELEKLIPDLQKLLHYAQSKDLLLGPGRGTSLASMVLFGEGYSPFNPLRFGLMPELFSLTRHIWLDVEYSNHEELGRICDEVNNRTELDVVAFRCPALDIFKEMRQQIGQVHFDSFSDNDPMILQAPLRTGARGLWDIEWSPDFDAFRRMTPENQKKYAVDAGYLMDWLGKNGIHSAMDFMNISLLAYFTGIEKLDEYRQGVCPPTLPELKETNGMLLYREDWLRIFMRLTGFGVFQAVEAFRAIQKGQTEALEGVGDTKIRELLQEKSQTVFLKSHMVRSWWYYKRTAILKSLWQEQYLAVLDRWEQRNGCVWQEFGYKRDDGSFHLKA